ncbi:MAG: hypothetical protein CMH52_09200 [Myxococcales bacterium]|nr:hypothetical protein [Myxococcales bacterium]
MSESIINSEWPEPSSGRWPSAFKYHLDDFSSWLNGAGAESRLAVGLFNDDSALHAFLEGLEPHGVIPVMTSSSDERPVPIEVIQHQGTHFNNKLFIVDGLDVGDVEHRLTMLNAQRNMLSRMATWVLLVVKNVESLCALYRWAPALVNDLQRRCLSLHPSLSQPEDVASIDKLKLWERNRLVAEQVFHTFMTGGQIAGYTDYSRLLRSGYGSAFQSNLTTYGHRWNAIWLGTSEQEEPRKLDLDLAEGIARHSDGLSDSDKRSLTQSLLARPIGRLAAGLDPRDGTEYLLKAVLEADDPSSLGDDWHEQIREAATLWGQDPTKQATLEFIIAQGAAKVGDVALCKTALNQALKMAEKAREPELMFDVASTQLKLNLALANRLEARTNLDIVDELVAELQSPFYAARSLVCLGDFMCQIDRNPAKQAFESAKALFDLHGYPAWSEAVRVRLERV